MEMIKYLYLLDNECTGEKYIDYREYEGSSVSKDRYKSDEVLKKVFLVYGKRSYTKTILHIFDDKKLDEKTIKNTIKEYAKLHNAKSLYGVSDVIAPVFPDRKILCLNNMRVYDSVETVRRVRGISEYRLNKFLNESSGEPFALGLEEDGKLLIWMYHDEYLKRKDLSSEENRLACINKINKIEKNKFPEKFMKGTNPENPSFILDKNGKIILRCREKYNFKIIRLNDGKVFDNLAIVSSKYGCSLQLLAFACENNSSCGKDDNGNRAFWMKYSDFVDSKKSVVELFKAKRYGSSYNNEKVICLNNEKVFNSLTEAADYCGVDLTGISRAYNSPNRSCGKDELGNGLFWMSYSKYLESDKSAKDIIKSIIENSQVSKQIICLNDKKIYKSLREVKAKTGCKAGLCINDNLYTSGTTKLDENGVVMQWMYYYKYLEKLEKGESVEPDLNLKLSRSSKRQVICLNDLKVYDTITEASKAVGGNVQATLSRNNYGIKSSGVDENGIAYQWMHYDEYLEKIKNGEKINFDPNLKPVKAYPEGRKVICLNNNKIYDTVREASEAVGAHISHSINYNSYGAKTSGLDENGVAYQWMHYDEYLKKLENNEEIVFDPNLKSRRLCTAVRCIETGEVFKSIAEASRKTGMSFESIKESTQGKNRRRYKIKGRRNKKNFTWELV